MEENLPFREADLYPDRGVDPERSFVQVAERPQRAMFAIDAIQAFFL